MNTRQCPIIAISNRKGGTGKTTTAVNLSAEWGRRGYQTLLIDLDSQGHAAHGMGLGDTVMNTGIHKLLSSEKSDIESVIYETAVDNVSLIPADSGYVSEVIAPERLRNLLQENMAGERFQRIIIDTPPTLDSLLINALVAANGVIVPFVPHFLAEIGVKQLSRLFYEIAIDYNAGLKLLGLLPIMYDRHIRLQRRVIDSLTRQFGQNKIFRGIRNNIKLAEAFEAGLPVNQYSQHCVGNMDYFLMVEELEMILSERFKPNNQVI